MKKTMLVLLSVVMVAAMVLTFTACTNCDRTGHKWDEGTETKAPTCGATGERVFTCEVCNATRTEDVAATGDHSWGAWGASSQAGKEERACSVCLKKDYRDEQTPACDHADAYKVDAKAAKCEEDGNSAYWVCDNCDKLFADNNGVRGAEISAIPTIGAIGHDRSGAWVNDETNKQHYKVCANSGCEEHLDVASCEDSFEWVNSDATYHWQKCEVCEHEYESEKAEHQYNQDEVCECGKISPSHQHAMQHVDGESATCTQDGTREHWHCTKCGNDYEDQDGERQITDGVTIPAQHTVDWDDLKPAVPGANCLTAGTVAHYQCSACDQYFDTERNEIDSIAGGPVGSHNWDEEVGATAPSCGTAGEIAHNHCSVCEKWYNEAGEEIANGDWVDPATGQHTFTGAWEKKDEEYHQRKCANCDEYDQEEHTWGTTVVSHNADGHSVKCDSCEATKTLDHVWEYSNSTVDQHTKTCNVQGCNEAVTEDHDFGTGDKADRHDCECGEPVCGETETSSEITYTPVNETVDGEDLVQQGGVIIRFEKAVGNDAPAFNNNVIRFYGGNTLTITAPGQGTITKIVITINNEKGSITTLFDVNEVGSYSNGTWTGSAHQVVLQNGASSSTAQVRITKIEITYTSTVTKGNHVWEVTGTTSATCTEGSTTTETCKRCGDVRTVTGDPLGHAEQLDHQLRQEPTCTAEGTVEYWFCSQCAKYFAEESCTTEIPEAELTIDKVAHNYADQPRHQGDGEHAGQHYQDCVVCNEQGRRYETCDKNDWGFDDNNHWRICSVCGYNHNEQEGRDTHSYDPENDQCVCGKSNPTHNHEWAEPVEYKAPTCTEAGNPAYVQCNTCGNYYTNEEATQQLEASDLVIAALGHNVNNVQFVDVPGADGTLHGKYCDRCQQYVEQSEHEWKSPAVNKDSKLHTVTCSVCDFSKDVAHDFGTEGSRKDCECGEPWCYVAENDSVSITRSNLTNTSYPTVGAENSMQNIGFGFKYTDIYNNNSAIQGNTNSSRAPRIWNTTAFSGAITSVTVDWTSSNSGKSLKVKFGTALGTYGDEQIISYASSPVTITVDASMGYTFIEITENSTGAIYINSITIGYATVTENHAWTEVGRTSGSCVDGTPDSVTYRCDRCQKEKTETEAVYHDIIHVDEVGATCTSTGTVAHYKCQVCEKTFRDEDGNEEWTPDTIEALNHDIAYNKQDGQHQAYCTRNDYTGSWENHSAEEWVSEEETHHQICEACGETFNTSSHSYTEDDKCVCGKPNPSTHNHDWDMDNWTSDVTGHWHACKNGCGEKTQDFVAHEWESIEDYKSDDTNHWKYCEECNFENKAAKESHDYDDDQSWYDYNDQDGSHSTLCQVCEEELTHTKSSVHYEDQGESGHKIVCDVDGCHFAKDVDHNFTGNTCDDCKYEKQVANPTEVYTIEFNSTTNSGSIGSYTNNWYVTCKGFKWNIVNCNNNNNNWNYIKAGSKSAASVASITTDKAMPETITKVGLTIDAITASSINSIKLYVSSSSDFTGVVAEGTFTKATGTQEITISNPQPNLYYKIEIDCAKASSNGTITISGVSYWGY
ncbi:MAG: hypothetical protein J1F68_04500 [Clostridiales bacterium]|nr:hypothetical protein [Clostridiales bacterium]